MLNSQPVSALTDERAARIMRIDLGDGSWLACSGPLDLWALYNENRYVRMLNKFEAQFVDRAILAASPAKVEPVSDDFADRLAAACIECEVPDSVYESLCLAASPPQPQPEPKK